MTNPEELQQFRRLYVDASKLDQTIQSLAASRIVEADNINKVVAQIEELLALLPLDLPEGRLLINPKDPDEAPLKRKDNLIVLKEANLQIVLEDWKFRLLNIATMCGDTEKYKPWLLAQANKCVALFPEKDKWEPWEKDMFTVFANQICYYADDAELEQPFQILKRAYAIAEYPKHWYIKEMMATYLAKFGQLEAAYAIVFEVLSIDPKFAQFQSYKTDEAYLAWSAGKEPIKPPPPPAEKPVEIPPFIYPDHPLVKQHADILYIIKKRVEEYRLSRAKKLLEKGWDIDNEFNEQYAMRKWSPEELEAFETTHGIHLPGEYKVYLMEIGSDNRHYFMMGEVPGIHKIDEEQLENIKKPFAITASKIHHVGHALSQKGWIFPDSEEWMEEGVIKGDLKALFGLPEGAKMTDGCFYFADSAGQNPLYLIMNGEFEGEVWADTLQYGVDARGCFGPASIKTLKLLEFVAESLLAKSVGIFYASEDGDWL